MTKKLAVPREYTGQSQSVSALPMAIRSPKADAEPSRQRMQQAHSLPSLPAAEQPKPPQHPEPQQALVRLPGEEAEVPRSQPGFKVRPSQKQLRLIDQTLLVCTYSLRSRLVLHPHNPFFPSPFPGVEKTLFHTFY